MRKVYFDINNGEIVKPRLILPASYRAILDWRFKIIRIDACFSIQNIEIYGNKWKEKELFNEYNDWNDYKWLMKSLKKYIRKNIFKIVFKKDWNFVINREYKYIPFWDETK